MKQTATPPTDGTQFVAVWMCDGNIWSETLKYDWSGKLLRYDAHMDGWHDELWGGPVTLPDFKIAIESHAKDVTYFIP